jgi:Ras-related protein Rab-1A
MNSSKVGRKNEITVKCIIIGDPSTGKTSIVRRYIDNAFETNYCTTIGVDFKQKSLLVDDYIIKLQLWDTAGQEKFKVMAKSYYKGSHASLIVYDITQKQTFMNVKSWAEQYMDTVSDDKPCVIILGNKCDLESDRAVKFEEGKELADKLHCIFKECSAKEGGDAFNSVFDSIFKDCIAKAIKIKDEQKQEVFKLSSKPQDVKNNKGCC